MKTLKKRIEEQASKYLREYNRYVKYGISSYDDKLSKKQLVKRVLEYVKDKEYIGEGYKKGTHATTILKDFLEDSLELSEVSRASALSNITIKFKEVANKLSKGDTLTLEESKLEHVANKLKYFKYTKRKDGTVRVQLLASRLPTIQDIKTISNSYIRLKKALQEEFGDEWAEEFGS